jgi:hypothetical protein
MWPDGSTFVSKVGLMQKLADEFSKICLEMMVN